MTSTSGVLREVVPDHVWVREHPVRVAGGCCGWMTGTYGIEGLETKRKDLHFDELLGEEPPATWAGQMDQVVIGNGVMREVEFLHRASRTLIATDLVENFSDQTPGTNAMLRVWMRSFRMWGRPRPAPELRWFTRDRKSARLALDRLLAWDFDRAIIPRRVARP